MITQASACLPLVLFFSFSGYPLAEPHVLGKYHELAYMNHLVMVILKEIRRTTGTFADWRHSPSCLWCLEETYPQSIRHLPTPNNAKLARIHNRHRRYVSRWDSVLLVLDPVSAPDQSPLHLLRSHHYRSLQYGSWLRWNDRRELDWIRYGSD